MTKRIGDFRDRQACARRFPFRVGVIMIEKRRPWPVLLTAILLGFAASGTLAETPPVEEETEPSPLELARQMMAAPADYTAADWQELAVELEAMLPELATEQQRLRADLRQARQAGRTDAAVTPLIEQRNEIEQQIEAAIEALPAVTNLQQAIQRSGAELTEAMSLRVRALQQAEQAETADEN